MQIEDLPSIIEQAQVFLLRSTETTNRDLVGKRVAIVRHGSGFL